MATRIVTANGVYDLSAIKNLKELQEEIEFLKSGIKREEQQLENHLRKAPSHLVKSTADNLLPSFLNKMIANGSWKLLLSGLTMFANPFSGKFSVKKNIVGSVKKLGLMALAKGAYAVWNNKRAALKSKPVIHVSKPQQVTSINTKPFKKN